MTDNVPAPSFNVPAPSFGQLLRRYRRAAGLTQEELAERATLSTRAVSDLERGEKRAPRRDTLDLLSDALHLSVEDRAILAGTVHRFRGDPSLHDNASPAVSAPTPLTASASGAPAGLVLPRLPVQLTPFLERAGEVEALCECLVDPATRLLTLTGPGGVGKTRLAVRLAAHVRDAFADGVAFVPLASVTDPNVALSTIAQALGLGEAGGRSLHETLVDALRGIHLLVVLDNVEQILPAAAQLVALLEQCPAVVFLVTSRTRLRVRGERVYTVPTLTVPPAAVPSADTLLGYEAVRLFMARARDAQPDFTLTDETAPAVAAICARLDGLPLALELVASRLRVLTPTLLLARLEQRMTLAVGGARDLPARQQTLRAAIDWSHDLLDPGAQQLFARLAVFAGGRTFEAVEAVCQATSGVPFDVLDGIDALLDSSLVRREESVVTSEPRFVMLETIHEYARERLEASGEKDTLAHAHARYYLAYAEKAEPDLTRPARRGGLARLDEEHDNLRAALTWSVDTGQAEIALRLSNALYLFWLMRGYLSEGRRWLERALTIAETRGLGGMLAAQALNSVAVLAATAGAYGEAGAFFERNLTIRRDIGDDQGSAAALNNLGNVAMQQRDYERADSLYAQALAIRRGLDDTAGIARVLGNLGELARLRGDGERAIGLATESITLYSGLGDMEGSARALNTLGGAALLLDDVERAASAYGQALTQSWHLGNVVEVSANLEGLATVAVRRGHLDHAALLLGAASTLRAMSDAPVPPSDHEATAQALFAAQAGLDATAFAVAWTAGKDLPSADVVMMAVEHIVDIDKAAGRLGHIDRYQLHDVV